MAKTRSRSRKSGASPRAKGTRKTAGARRKTSAKRAKPAARRPKGLDLKRLRRDIDMAVSSLARRVARAEVAQPSAKLDQAQTTLSRWAAEIDNLCDPNERDICGPSMVIPLA